MFWNRKKKKEKGYIVSNSYEEVYDWVLDKMRR